MRGWPLIVLAGCGTPWIEEIDGSLRVLTTTLNANGSGSVKVSIKPRGESTMLVTAQPLDPNLDCHVRTLQVGNTVPFRADQEVTSDRARTNAGFIGHAVSLNWPISEEDGFLIPNQRHRVQVGVVDQSLAYTGGATRFDVLLKNDPDFSSGALRVNLVYAGATGSDPEITAAIEQAVDLWRGIYRNVGLELDVLFFDYLGPGTLMAPGQGDEDVYEAIADSTRFGAVNMVVLDDIAGIDGIYGFAGDIPGPLVPTGRSAVAVNAGISAGTDGVFSPREVQTLAETMAHEAGHFIGLYHPVEATYDSWDALDDTPDCSNQLQCMQLLGGNLMFPFPVCDGVSCVPQVAITGQQGGVAHRYTGVL